MFNFSDEAKNEFVRLKKIYEARGEDIIYKVQSLYKERKEAVKLIQEVNIYVSSLNHCPESIKNLVAEAYKNTEKFRQVVDWENEGIFNKANKSKITDETIAMIGGEKIGTAVEKMGPSVAMALVSTIGVASTGSSISTIGGISAVNTALLMLGGGALSVGARAVASGTALLALAGPIGWAAAAAGFLSLEFSEKNKYEELSQEIRDKLRILEPKIFKIDQMIDNTKNLSSQISRIRSFYGHNDFNEVNYSRNELFHIVSLSATLSKSINETVLMCM